MSKYTNKIIKFIDNNLSKNLIIHNFDRYEIINTMKNIFDIVSKEHNEIKLIKSTKINKIHDYENNGLLFIIYNKLYNNINNFVSWYRMEKSNIDLRKSLKKYYKKYYDILFNPIESRKKLHELLYDNNFVSYDTVQHAESENLIYKIYEGNNSEIHIYSISEDKFPDIDIISKIISFMRKLFNKNTKLNLTIFYGQQKKYITSHDKYICSDNVNSGASVMGVQIVIWREEEFYKVLIHELVHYFDVDFYINDAIYSKINNIFQKKFKIDTNSIDRVNESYTEALATVIHSVIYSQIKNLDFNRILSYELLFEKFQIAKIFNHHKKFGGIYQKTSAFSYYIIKHMLLANYDELFNFWHKYGFFIKNNEYEYIKLYQNTLNKININKEIEKIHFNSYLYDNKFIMNTMRMTMFQN
jgi:hypothetical protein